MSLKIKMLERVKQKIGDFIHGASVRYCASDDTVLELAYLFGNIRKGEEYHIRGEGNLAGRLFRVTMLDNAGRTRTEDLGNCMTPANLRLYYRDSRDAPLKERLIMALF